MMKRSLLLASKNKTSTRALYSLLPHQQQQQYLFSTLCTHLNNNNNNPNNSNSNNNEETPVSYFDDHLKSLIEKNRKKMEKEWLSQSSSSSSSAEEASENQQQNELKLRQKLGLPDNYPIKSAVVLDEQQGETVQVVYNDSVEEQKDTIMSNLIDKIFNDVSLLGGDGNGAASGAAQIANELNADFLVSDETEKDIKEKVNAQYGISSEEMREKESLAARLSFDQAQKNTKLHDQLEKFYKSMSIHPHLNVTPDGEKGFVVRIGAEQMLRSPSGRVIVFPNRHLAAAVVGEWELQRGYLRPATMPLTDLVGQWQDLKTEVAEGVVTGFGRMVKRTIVGFFDSEVVCLRQNFSKSKSAQKRMNELWDPLVSWFEREYDTKLNIAGSDIDFSDDCAQNEAREAFIQRYSTEENLKQFKELFFDWSSGVDLAFLLLEKLSPHQLITLYAGTQITKSIVISAAIMHNQIDAKSALEASQLLVREQVRHYGLVEGEHDVLFAEEACKLGALTLFRSLCEYQQS